MDFIRASLPIVDAAQSRDQNHVCVELEYWFYSVLLGYASQLTHDSNYKGTPAQIWDATNDARNNLDMMMQPCGCDAIAPEFRILDGVLEWRISDTAAWEQLGQVVGATGVPGADGAPGLPGLPGVNGAPGDCSCVDAVPVNPQETDDANYCNGATYLAEYLFDKLLDTLDIIEAAADTISAMDALIAWFPPGYFILDALTDLLNEIAEAGVQVVRAWDTVENRESIACELYCATVSNAGFVGGAWQDYLDHFPALSPALGETAFEQYCRTFDFDAVRARFNLGTYQTGAICSSCECETIEECAIYPEVPATLGGGIWTIQEGTFSDDIFFEVGDVISVRIDFPSEDVIWSGVGLETSRNAPISASSVIIRGYLNGQLVHTALNYSDASEGSYGWYDWSEDSGFNPPSGVTIDRVDFIILGNGMFARNLQICVQGV